MIYDCKITKKHPLMRNILIVGAGRSSSTLIEYLLNISEKENLHLTIGDINPQAAKKLIQDHPRVNIIKLDVFQEAETNEAISNSDLVISMLPASMHLSVAKACIVYKKNMVTASYVSKEMAALNEEVEENGLTFMNEIGLDPGIDHMSAMQVIDRIRDAGGKILSFESFCGGLVAPESDNNLWNYKFTWNPRNVVLAGQGGAAEFKQEGTYKYIPYHRLFRRTEFLEVEGYGLFEAYANRNSLAYQSVYGLENALTLFRGTMRRVGFSRAWNMFVQLGMTDDSYTIPDSENLTYREYVNLFLPYSPTDSVELKMRYNLRIDQDDVMWEKLLELDLFNGEKRIGIVDATPAQALESILMQKWSLDPEDKDMIVMYHKFGYELNGKKSQIDSSMVCTGRDQIHTAMAKTVGLPVAMAAVGILNKKITSTGVLRPIKKEVYEPILKEMEAHGIIFHEKEREYLGYNPDNLF